MIGTTVGHYKILDKLGAGGMGEVYRAEDTTLDREVALKVLPDELSADPDRLARFEREAKTLAALDHPNIVHIYTVEESEGVRFLTMQLVEGNTLSEIIPKDGMALDRIFDIAVALGDALATAHEKGVIHRDLKPANIMVTDEGRVKVLDFGLAKLRQEAESPAATQLPTEHLTQEGVILGTMPYMSPEQLEGKSLDGRTDVFSLGVILYEMATGHRPFQGDTSASLIMSIGRDTAPEVDTVRGELPHHLGRVIGRCLDKDPNKRFQTIKDVRNEFAALKRETDSSVTSASRIDVPQVESRKQAWWSALVVTGLVVAALGSWLLLREPEPGAQSSIVKEVEDVAETPAASIDSTGAAAGPNRKMIVVLPFENLGDPEDDYFAAGMTEEITSRLAIVSGMGVISRKSALRYADTDKTMQEIGDDLGVDYVLEGTVRWAKEGDSSRVRITPQLIQVSDDTHLWANTYDRVIEDVFAIQSEIAEGVVAELGVNLLDTERQSLAVELTGNPDAYQAYLRGIALWTGSIGTTDAVSMFQKAVELDPRFARAWAWLSRVKLYQHFYWWDGATKDTLEEAKLALERATAFAPDDAQVRVGEGYYYYYGLRDFDRALETFEAIAKDFPNDPEVLQATGTILRRQGRWDASNEAYLNALALDPQNISILESVADNYRAQRRFEEALETLDRAIAATPEPAALYDLKSQVLLDRGSIDAAREVLVRAPVTEPMYLAWFYVDFYDRRWESILERAKGVPREDHFHRLIADFFSGAALLELGRPEKGREVWQSAASQTEGMVREGGDRWRELLGLIYSALGRYEEAVVQAERAVGFWEGDHATGPQAEETLAFVHANAGEVVPAVALFDRLLATTYLQSLTVGRLRLDPRLDAIRDDPRFQTMLEKHAREGG